MLANQITTLVKVENKLNLLRYLTNYFYPYNQINFRIRNNAVFIYDHDNKEYEFTFDYILNETANDEKILSFIDIATNTFGTGE